MRLYLIPVLVSLAVAAPAFAQEDNGALMGKIDRLERDITYLQKQVYRNKGGEVSDGGAPANSGGLEVRLSQMTEELRQLRGAVEQVQFANRQNTADMKKFAEDVEYRLHALEEKQMVSPAPMAPVAAPAPAPVAAEPVAPAKFEPAKKGAAAAPALTGNDFPDANAHYSYAFKLLNEKRYPEASATFDAFVKKYPTDPLTANAYYWLGESYYARADYTRSSDSFRKGFEANPEGQKAPDNLFKLAKSLVQVKRTPEACVVLTQLSKKYGAAAPRVSKLADDERVALQCK